VRRQAGCDLRRPVGGDLRRPAGGDWRHAVCPSLPYVIP
jgi:hypothetical protein